MFILCNVCGEKAVLVMNVRLCLLCRDLSTNQLTAVTALMFTQLTSLQHLKLGWNEISYITERAFDDLSALKTL